MAKEKEELDEVEKRDRKELIKFIVMVVLIIIAIWFLLPCIKAGADYLIKDNVDSATVKQFTRWWDH